MSDIDVIEQLYRRGEYSSAESEAIRILDNLRESHSDDAPVCTEAIELACKFCDIGDAGRSVRAVQISQQLFEANRDLFVQKYGEISYHYNLGNVFSALGEVEKRSHGFRYVPEHSTSLTEAKRHFWRSYKLLRDKGKKEWPQLLINLANALSNSSRIAEAMLLYDRARQIAPEIVQSHSARAVSLEWLNQVSHSYSLKMLAEIYQGYSDAAALADSGDPRRNTFEMRCSSVRETIERHGTSIAAVIAEDNIDNREFDELSEYRKFSLRNGLFLSEHGIYCWCNGARRDDLTIPTKQKSVSGSFVPRLELLLNRLKSEFSLARHLYCQAIQEIEENDAVDAQSCFTELENDECIGISIESARAAFRICFGILDKIALGICELYGVVNKSENLYFERFWKQDKDRWELLNAHPNPGLMGLYSIATDLNRHNGEWGTLKQWRNSLEHGILAVTHTDHSDDPYGTFNHASQIFTIEREKFLSLTSELLRMTRSAIYCFVWTTRTEALHEDFDGPAVTIQLAPKE